MSRLKDRKFKAKGKMAKHKPKPWQKVKRGKETQAVTGIEAQEEAKRAQLECKSKQKLITKIQKRHQTWSATSKPKF